MPTSMCGVRNVGFLAGTTHLITVEVQKMGETSAGVNGQSSVEISGCPSDVQALELEHKTADYYRGQTGKLKNGDILHTHKISSIHASYQGYVYTAAESESCGNRACANTPKIAMWMV